jgi:Carboxypeptidase regulatory-like domain
MLAEMVCRNISAAGREAASGGRLERQKPLFFGASSQTRSLFGKLSKWGRFRQQSLLISGILGIHFSEQRIRRLEAVLFDARFCILLLVISLPSSAWAASDIVGTLTDPSGAAVPGATVIVSHRGTAAERRTESNSLGDFVVDVLPPGLYQITILKPGFHKTVSSDITLRVDQTLRFDAVLQLGEISFQTEVSGAPIPLETDSSTLGQVMDRQRVKDLPLNQRQFLSLTLLVPGASTPAYGSFNLTLGGAIHVNGAREFSNTFLLDGVDNNDPRITNTLCPLSSRRSKSSRYSRGILRRNLGGRREPKSTWC